MNSTLQNVTYRVKHRVYFNCLYKQFLLYAHNCNQKQIALVDHKFIWSNSLDLQFVKPNFVVSLPPQLHSVYCYKQWKLKRSKWTFSRRALCPHYYSDHQNVQEEVQFYSMLMLLTIHPFCNRQMNSLDVYIHPHPTIRHFITHQQYHYTNNIQFLTTLIIIITAY